MAFRVTDKMLADMAQAREEERVKHALELAGLQVRYLRQAGKSINLDDTQMDKMTHVELIEYIVNYQFPPIGPTGNEAPLPEGWVSPDRPADLSEYRDIVGQAQSWAPPRDISVEVEKARRVGGFYQSEIPDVGFVGYRTGDGSIAKLEVEDVLELSHFDDDPRRRMPVVVVSIPGLFEADYVKEILRQVHRAASVGTSVGVLQIISGVLSEQGWQLEDLGPPVEHEPLASTDATQSLPLVQIGDQPEPRYSDIAPAERTVTPDNWPNQQ